MTHSAKSPSPSLIRAVIAVGEARGAVIGTNPAFVVTAAHCLPCLPQADPWSDPNERIYKGLLGRLDDKKQEVWAQCLFVDPISDIAILGRPNNQSLPDQAEKYKGLVSTACFDVTQISEPCQAWVLSLKDSWESCTLSQIGGGLWIEKSTVAIEGGMSGSPIVSDKGAVIGVISNGSETGDTMLGPQPSLKNQLPGWLLDELGLQCNSEDGHQ